MTSPEWRRCLQPLLLTGLFCCWLLFATLGGLWLLVSERQVAQQALAEQAQLLQLSLQQQLVAVQHSARLLLHSLAGVSQQDEILYRSYLFNYRGQHPPVGQLALLAANPAPGAPLRVLAHAGNLQGMRLLSGQDLAKQPVLAAAMPALWRGQAQLLVWQRRDPEQWLLLVPGENGLTLAIWLQPRQLLPERIDHDRYMQLSAMPVVPQQAQEGQNLFVQLPLYSGAFALNLTLWQPWGLSALLGWRMLVLGVLLALLAALGWRAWRIGSMLLQTARQSADLRQQWLAQAAVLSPVSVQGALATLERKAQQRAQSQRLLVWWVHGKNTRRLHWHGESAMLRLEHYLLHAPFDGVQVMRLRQGGLLLALQIEAGQADGEQARLSAWLAKVMALRMEDAVSLWQEFDVSDGVQTLERSIAGARLHLSYLVPASEPPGR